MSAAQRISRWGWVVAVVVAATVLAVVVSSGGDSPARAATPATNDTVTISGTGTVQAVPDEVTTTFSVHVSRGGVQEALDGISASVDKVLTTLRKAGVPSKHVRTTGLSLYRHYDRHGTPTGYDASEVVSATLSPLKTAGKIISAAATASGNDVTVGGLSFSVNDDSPLLTQARKKAFDDARGRADEYAGLSHRSLGAVEKISETVATNQPRSFAGSLAFSAAASAPDALPIRAGEQPVAVTVTVVWQLR